MRLLLDENLSPQLVDVLADLFTGSVHVRDVGLASANDADIWVFARAQSFTVVTKDSDFRQLGFLYGPPPKVVWVRRGNCSTTEIGELLRRRHGEIVRFGEQEEAALLIVD